MERWNVYLYYALFPPGEVHLTRRLLQVQQRQQQKAPLYLTYCHVSKLLTSARAKRCQIQWVKGGTRVFGGLMATRLQPQNFPKIRAGWPYSEPRLMQLERLAFWEWLNQLRKLSKLVRLNSWQVSPQSCLNLIRYEGHIMIKWLDYICIGEKEWMKGFIKIIWML